MSTYPYHLQQQDARPMQLGLIVLETDETIERDLRRLVPERVDLLVSRVPFATDVSAETLQAMDRHITASAALLPHAARFVATGYGCTSATARIGPLRIAELVRKGCTTDAVTEPVSALIAACGALKIARLAFLSPYVEEVSACLRHVLGESGIDCVAVGSFNEPDDSHVARIDPGSTLKAAREIATGSEVDAVFLSCTNLQTLDIIAPLEAELGRPVLSSNLVLAWHMLKLAGLKAEGGAPGCIWTV